MKPIAQAQPPAPTSGGESERALLILRTPLQARLSLLALSAEGISNFDALYITERLSEKDLHYFHLVSKKAHQSAILRMRASLPSIISNLIVGIEGLRLAKTWGRGHDVAVLGSINSWAIIFIVKQLKLPYITVDDGSANIDMGSFFFGKGENSRSRLYRRLVAIGGLDNFKKRILRHYTVFPDLPNIVEPDRLRALQPWDFTDRQTQNGAGLVLLVGTAEASWMDKPQVASIIEKLRQFTIDFYIPHPMESGPLLADVPRLDSTFEIAEDAILRIAETTPVHLVGPFSTVFLTTAGATHRRTVLIPKGHESFARLAEFFGCEVVFLD